MTHQWYRLKRAILEILLLLSEQWLYDTTLLDGLDPLDTAGFEWPGFYTFNDDVRVYPPDMEIGEYTIVKDCTCVGRGILRHWFLFEISVD